MLDVLLVVVVVAAVVAAVAAPLRPGATTRALEAEEAQHADLEAAKQAKYAELRELELDFRTGKVQEADFRAQDRALRAEAIELLRLQDELGVRADAAAEARAEGAAAAR